MPPCTSPGHRHHLPHSQGKGASLAQLSPAQAVSRVCLRGNIETLPKKQNTNNWIPFRNSSSLRQIRWESANHLWQMAGVVGNALMGSTHIPGGWKQYKTLWKKHSACLVGLLHCGSFYKRYIHSKGNIDFCHEPIIAQALWIGVKNTVSHKECILYIPTRILNPDLYSWWYSKQGTLYLLNVELGASAAQTAVSLKARCWLWSSTTPQLQTLFLVRAIAAGSKGSIFFLSYFCSPA